MGVPENIDALLVKFDINQDCLARIAGVAPSTVTRWRNGAMPREKPIRKIVEHFGLTRDDIVSDSLGLAAKEHRTSPIVPGAIPIQPSPVAYLPLLGSIHAGVAEEPDVFDSADRCQVPAWVAEEHPRAFLLKVEGDCMDRVYPEGCLVAIDPDAEAVSGCVAAVQIDDTDFLMRRYIRTADTLVLSPDSYNPAHRDRVFSGDDWDDHFVRVVGRVVWYMCDGELG